MTSGEWFEEKRKPMNRFKERLRINDLRGMVSGGAEIHSIPRLLLSLLLVVLGRFSEAGGADWKIVPELQSGHVVAAANQSFGVGGGKSQKTPLPEGASFPEFLEASASDEKGDERSARSEIRLEMENGLLRLKGKLQAIDSNPNDFLAPLATGKGAVVLDLKVLLPPDKKSVEVKGFFRLTNEGPPSLAGMGEGKPAPENISVQIRLNDKPLLKSEDLPAGIEKEVALTLRNGDVLTLVLQAEFSIFSSGQAEPVSTLRYGFRR